MDEHLQAIARDFRTADLAEAEVAMMNYAVRVSTDSAPTADRHSQRIPDLRPEIVEFTIAAAGRNFISRSVRVVAVDLDVPKRTQRRAEKRPSHTHGSGSPCSPAGSTLGEWRSCCPKKLVDDVSLQGRPGRGLPAEPRVPALCRGELAWLHAALPKASWAGQEREGPQDAFPWPRPKCRSCSYVPPT